MEQQMTKTQFRDFILHNSYIGKIKIKTYIYIYGVKIFFIIGKSKLFLLLG